MEAGEQKHVVEELMNGVVFAVLVSLVSPVFAPSSWLEFIPVTLVAFLLLVPVNRVLIRPLHKSLTNWRDNL